MKMFSGTRMAIFLLTGVLTGCAGCARADIGVKTEIDAQSVAGRQMTEGKETEGQEAAGQSEPLAALSAQASEYGQKDGETGSRPMRSSLRIVDGAQTGVLVLAGDTIYDTYTLDINGKEIAFYLDGKAAEASALEDGMMAEIVYGAVERPDFGQSSERIVLPEPGRLQEVESVSVYSLGTEQNPGGAYYDLCGLYLQVLNDLWDRDDGLNNDVMYVSIDLDEAPGGLTEGEKAAVAWIFARAHQVAGLNLTYQELAQQGYLTELEFAKPPEGAKVYQWENGVLFSVKAEEGEGNPVFSLPVLKFDAKKWRTPIGAYYFMDCEAVWAEFGTWSGYSVGAEAIS